MMRLWLLDKALLRPIRLLAGEYPGGPKTKRKKGSKKKEEPPEVQWGALKMIGIVLGGAALGAMALALFQRWFEKRRKLGEVASAPAPQQVPSAPKPQEGVS